MWNWSCGDILDVLVGSLRQAISWKATGHYFQGTRLRTGNVELPFGLRTLSSLLAARLGSRMLMQIFIPRVNPCRGGYSYSSYLNLTRLQTHALVLRFERNLVVLIVFALTICRPLIQCWLIKYRVLSSVTRRLQVISCFIQRRPLAQSWRKIPRNLIRRNFLASRSRHLMRILDGCLPESPVGFPTSYFLIFVFFVIGLF